MEACVIGREFSFKCGINLLLKERIRFQGGDDFSPLTLKALITTAADDIHKYVFIVFQRK